MLQYTFDADLRGIAQRLTKKRVRAMAFTFPLVLLRRQDGILQFQANNIIETRDAMPNPDRELAIEDYAQHVQTHGLRAHRSATHAQES
jgi:hypothetical protein